MGLLSLTPFRQLSRIYGALLSTSHSLVTIAQQNADAHSALVAQVATLAAKLEDQRAHDQLRPPAPDVEPSPPAPPRHDINLLLHQARSAMMRDMPPHAQCVVSAGCSGRWYFDWIEQTYGHIPQHLGIEFYMPKPDSLPDNVKWIANTAGNMDAVSDQSCDLLISGQNIEHLWPDDIADFLLESARVLKLGGTLCVDSPNRVITALLNWSQPEHTIELSVPEMLHMLALAGFDVTKRAGIWLCRDPKSGRMLPHDPNVVDPEWSITERMVSAADKPEHSFIWWIESRRTEREPDRHALRHYLYDIYAKAWPERTQRLLVWPGLSVQRREAGEWISVPAGYDDVVFYGPYMPLRAGRHRVTFEFDGVRGEAGIFARCDVVVGPDATVIAQREARVGETHVTIELDIQKLEFGAQFRCFGVGGAAFSVRRHIVLVEELEGAAIVG
jgi:SAM-dependent methyltransferase